jgi:hypothetical protein
VNAAADDPADPSLLQSIHALRLYCRLRSDSAWIEQDLVGVCADIVASSFEGFALLFYRGVVPN